MKQFSRKEKEVIGILSIGTFLEYFDFYLYFHMATLLNKVFFEVGDVRSNALLLYFGYCSSYIFRPIGALVLGYIGDKWGRKIVINLTFVLMGISCIGIYFLPSYEAIGVWASVMITFYRALQGISTMGDIIGGEIYLAEYLQGKKVFIGVLVLILVCSIACQVALYGIQAAMEEKFPWRYLFLGGIVIFGVGYFGRRCLVESPEFMNNKIARATDDTMPAKFYLASFFIETLGPVGLLLSVVGFNSVFRNVYNYSELEIVTRNLNATYCCIGYNLVAIFLTQYINPYKLAYFRNQVAIILILSLPAAMYYLMSWELMIFIQSVWCMVAMGDLHMKAVLFKNSPIKIRMKLGTLSFSLARALVAVITTFGLTTLEQYVGYLAYTIIGLPFMLMYEASIKYVKSIDEKNPKGLLRYYR